MKDETRKILGRISLVSALTVLVVALGRLWTKSYFDTFGLPTSDLRLSTEEYAFTAKEALVMVALAAIVAVGLWWAHRDGHLQLARDDGRLDAWSNRFVAASSFVLALFLAAQTFSGLPGLTPLSNGIERFWVQSAIVLGLSVGVLSGLLAIAVRSPRTGRRGRIAVAVVLIALPTMYLPAAVAQLGRASAMRVAQTRDLAHAVIEFEDVAPVAIRRGDDDSRSVRVYVLLSTPDRIAVAHPYPCRQVTTAETREIPLDTADLHATSGSDVCDTVVFDRDRVRAVRVLGSGGRPSNDEPNQADHVEVAADPVDGEVRTRDVYVQAFDFAEARQLEVTCNGRRIRGSGVWLRIAPKDAGWVSVDGGPGGVLRAPAAKPSACVDEDVAAGGVRFKVAPGQDQLVYLYAPTADERSLEVRTAVVRYTPLATFVDLTEMAELRVAVEVASEQGCDGSGPTIAAPGVGAAARCEHDAGTGTVTYLFEPVAPAPAGSWRVGVCSGDEDVEAIRVTATPLEAIDEPTALSEAGNDPETDVSGQPATPVAVPCPDDDGAGTRAHETVVASDSWRRADLGQ